MTSIRATATTAAFVVVFATTVAISGAASSTPSSLRSGLAPEAKCCLRSGEVWTHLTGELDEDDMLASGGDPRFQTCAQIIEVQNDAAEDGWDGPGTHAVSSESVQRAFNLVAVLPEFLPAPDVCATPSGSIALSWDSDNGANLTILVPNSGGIGFASLAGKFRVNGADPFEHYELPGTLLAAIEEWRKYSSAG